MPERGGPTTQSGILFQNSVIALYLGALTDGFARPSHEQIVRLRVEAPTNVDDFVITYADGHVAYVHVKERLSDDQTAWRSVWTDFAAQFNAPAFVRGRDRLRLHIGEFQPWYEVLRGLCERIRTSEGPVEWRSRLSEEQTRFVSKIEVILGTSLTGGDEILGSLLEHVEVEFWPSSQLERDQLRHWMPTTNLPPVMLFRLLRDRVAGEARVRGTFEPQLLRESLRREGDVVFQVPADIDVLRAAITDAGALLRQHKHTLGRTGVHFTRAVVEEIVSWSVAPGERGAVAMLLDQAGGGKTVVMRDVQAVLESRGASVLAIKADQQLTGISTSDQLQQRLGLPEAVEQLCGRLGLLGPVVVIVDQIDALSLSMARDQRTLDVVLDMISRLRTVPGVRVILSCRPFDRNTDPRLNRIELTREFRLLPLSLEEVAAVIQGLGLSLEELTPATAELLRLPLHLDLFATIAQAQHGPARLHGIASLQQLYGLLWDDVILRANPDGPAPADLERVLRLATERMDRQQRTSVPRSFLYGQQAAGLERAIDRLASAGVLIGGSHEWTFLHQTFFDYCYARFFVADGRGLAEVVLASDQGLFTRSQLMQVLAYLRGSGDSSYLRELNTLLKASQLRRHLRELLWRWFGGLPDPSDDEWLLAQRFLQNRTERSRLLGWMGGSSGWFARLRSGLLNDLLTADPVFVDNAVVPYLASNLSTAQAEVVAIADSWLERDSPWRERAWRVLLYVRVWEPAGIALYERWVASLPLEESRELYEIDDIAKADAAAGARLVRAVLDKVLDAYLDQSLGERLSVFRGLGHQLELLNGSGTAQAIDLLSTRFPMEFLEEMVPWLNRVLASHEPSEIELDPYYYRADPLSSGWHDTVDVVHHQLVQALIAALTALGRTEPAQFQEWVQRLSASPFATPQRLVANAYRELAPVFADEALAFLASDPRRLEIGENEAYETRKLIEAAAPHAADHAVMRLEQAVLIHAGAVRSYYRRSLALRWRGVHQMHLLRAFSRQRLSGEGQKVLAELERKFPDVVASDRPGRLVMGWGGAPIEYESTSRMSDTAWLRAMARYSRGASHADFMRGGARELAGLLRGHVTANPSRFFTLALRTPGDLDDHYAAAFMRGLADSECPAEWVFELVRRFSVRKDREIWREINSALERVAGRSGGLPPDLLELLEGWVRQQPREDETGQFAQEQELRFVFINTLRGGAFEALMRAQEAVEGDEGLEARWRWIEYVATDPSVVLRAGAIRELLPLLDVNRERALVLFARLVDGFPRLRESSTFHEFLYHASFGHFAALGPYIAEMMQSAKADARQRGAELATIAHISPRGLENEAAANLAYSLAEQALVGDTACRRGAARIYARNLANGPVDLCVDGLRRLLNDSAEQVCREVAWIAHELRGEHRESLSDFLLEFAGSRSGLEGSNALAEFLWDQGHIDPEWGLAMVEALLNNPNLEHTKRGLGGGEELVRLVLRIYMDPTADRPTRELAMDTFDRLMELKSYDALTALDEWDRR